MSISTIRHDELFPSTYRNDPVHIIGCGAIGSRVVASLVELGLTNLHVYDYDVVEPHNLANQMFFNHDIGFNKVHAMENWVKLKLGHPVESMTFNLTKLTPEDFPDLTGTVFLCVDSIEARKMIVHEVHSRNQAVFHIFDTRMASTHGNVIHLQPLMDNDVADYITNLPSDEHTEVSACGTSLTVGATASIIANLAVWQFMHAKHNPEALDRNVEIYLKPLMLMQ